MAQQNIAEMNSQAESSMAGAGSEPDLQVMGWRATYLLTTANSLVFKAQAGPQRLGFSMSGGAVFSTRGGAATSLCVYPIIVGYKK